MDEPKRLELITEAVRYCQHVSAMGMPAVCYTKALREPIHYLWERREGKGKLGAVRHCSVKARDLRAGAGQLIYDHAVPFRLLQEELLALRDPTPDVVREVLIKHGVIVLITKEENALLNRARLGRKMPPDWDGSDPLARYKTARIEIVDR